MAKTISDEVLTENVAQHHAARAWRLIETVQPGSIQTLKLRHKSEVYRLTGAGAYGSAVIAKRCFTTTAAVETIIYKELLPRLPLPALRCYGTVEEAGGIYSWLFLEEAEGPDFSAVGEAHRAQAGEWLGSLQVAALQAGLESRLPARTTQYYLDLLRASREAIRGLLANPLVPVEDCAILCALVAEYDILEAHWHKLEAMCEGAPPTISHGDFATKNCRLRPGIGGEEFLVFDWEMAGWGVPAVDLAQATGGVVSPDLSAYSAVLRRHGIRLSPARLLRLAACGKVFRLLSVVAWACTWQENDSHLLLRKPLGSLRSFESRVAETLRTMQWAA